MTDKANDGQPGAAPEAPQTNPLRYRRWLLPAVLGVVVLALVLGGYGYYRHALYTPAKLTEAYTLRVRPKESFREVVAELEREHLVPSASILRQYAKRKGLAEKIKPGIYAVQNGMRPVDILDMLVEGTKPVAFEVTIPEGKWVSEMPDFLREHWPQAAQDFPRVAADLQRWRAAVPFPLEGDRLEGYLFPDTYEFKVDASAQEIISRMLDRFAETCWKMYQDEKDAGDTRSFHDVLVIASLVEAEAKVDKERPLIAGVIMHRLRIHMPLEIDATAIYAHGKRLKRVLFKDLEIKSPYNTYDNAVTGLPIGPICNPGVKSFEAALHPAETDALFYVAKGDGSGEHEFTTRIGDHNAARQRYQGTE